MISREQKQKLASLYLTRTLIGLAAAQTGLFLNYAADLMGVEESALIKPIAGGLLFSSTAYTLYSLWQYNKKSNELNVAQDDIENNQIGFSNNQNV